MDLEPEIDRQESDASPPFHKAEVAPPVFHRSATNRKIAGVAGGIAERFEIDANIVRVVFVLLSFLWGVGVAVYVAVWAIVPSEETTDVVGPDEEPVAPAQRWSVLRAIALFGVAVCVGLLLTSVGLPPPLPGRGFLLVWISFVVMMLAITLPRSRPRRSVRRVAIGTLAIVASIVVVGSGAVLGYVAMGGVPIAGGSGEKVFQPTTVGEIKPSYQMAFGQMTLDLQSVPFRDDHVAISASVAVGRLVVEVPPGVVVNLSALSGSNAINYSYGSQQFASLIPTSTRHPKLDLNAKVGIGNVELVRIAPNAQPFAP